MSFNSTDGSMYREVFGPLLSVKTWHTMNAEDERRFFIALHAVVEDPNFNPDQMEEFFIQTLELETAPHDNDLALAVEHYTAAAWAVKSYLSATASSD